MEQCLNLMQTKNDNMEAILMCNKLIQIAISDALSYNDLYLIFQHGTLLNKKLVMDQFLIISVILFVYYRPNYSVRTYVNRFKS